ncbi:MAG: Asp-tRNA(Asn)/Glu-tRNA(Gln) amidotransferase subunit GatB [Candidatus Pacearchaeota archaeon]
MKNDIVKIGLEIHCYLTTKEKLFCRCKAIRHFVKQNIKPNTNICPICTGMPGSKPMLPNEEAIKKAISIGLILNCNINKKIIWQRKHYDWPDLPKGYQITQSGSYSIPLAEKGFFDGIKIKELHLEEDPASWNPETGEIDYNRSGLPLVEIVTEPNFNSSEQVVEWIKNLLLTLSYIKAIEKNAGIKVDVNISTNNGERVEVKNISSIENIKKAIDYELKRQKKETAKRETRRFDETINKTVVMRKKEKEEDYRFIPEPDLPILKISEKEIEDIKKSLPETPSEKLNKLIKKYKIDEKNAKILTKNLDIVEFFEGVAEKIDAKFALPWITIELLRVLNYNKKSLDEVDIKVEHFIELLEAVKNKKITELKAKQILNEFVPNSFSIKKNLKEFEKISEKEIEKICKEVIEENKKAVSDYKNGEEKALSFLIGAVMKKSDRRADINLIKKILLKEIEK